MTHNEALRQLRKLMRETFHRANITKGDPKVAQQLGVAVPTDVENQFADLFSYLDEQASLNGRLPDEWTS